MTMQRAKVHAYPHLFAREVTGKALAQDGIRGHHSRQNSPFSLCWKEGENSLAVILAIRASSWAF